MKHAFSPIVTTVVVLLAACTTNEGYHRSYILSPQAYTTYWADQPSDTLWYVTTENHVLRSSAEWLTIPSAFQRHDDFQANSEYSLWAPVFFAPNTTGRARQAFVYLKTDDPDYDVTAMFIQVAGLAVSRPSTYLGTDYSIGRPALQLQPDGGRDSISFAVYGDWTLTALGGTWLTPEQLSGQAGSHVVPLTVSKNESSLSRIDTLVLTSCGVRDSIYLTQESLLKN